MCDILMETTKDEYLIELCDNITHTQRAEIAWMAQWLEARDMPATASCQDNCTLEAGAFAPCEDTLATSSFCHGIAGKSQDGYCRCDEATFNASGYSCSEPTWVDGFGLFVPEILCARSCGTCPTSMDRPLWAPSCDGGHEHHHGGMDHDHTVSTSRAGEDDPKGSTSGGTTHKQAFLAMAMACLAMIQIMFA